MSHTQIIEVDFNAQNEDGSIRLTTFGAVRSIEDRHLRVGDKVLLTDGETSLWAHLVARDRILVAMPSKNDPLYTKS